MTPASDRPSANTVTRKSNLARPDPYTRLLHSTLTLDPYTRPLMVHSNPTLTLKKKATAQNTVVAVIELHVSDGRLETRGLRRAWATALSVTCAQA